MYLCVCVCVCEGERERERVGEGEGERERERERERETSLNVAPEPIYAKMVQKNGILRVPNLDFRKIGPILSPCNFMISSCVFTLV